MRVKRRLLLPILLALFLLTGVAVAVSYRILTQHINEDTKLHMSGLEQAFAEHIRFASVPWPKDSPFSLLFSSLDTIPASAASAINHYLSLSGEPFVDISMKKKKYRVSSFPLADAAGNEIGKFAVLDDITDAASLQHLLLRMSIILVVAGCGVFCFFVVYLGKIDHKLIRSRSKLEATAQELEQLKDNLEQRVAEQTTALTNTNEELRQTIIEVAAAQQGSRDAYNELNQIFQANSSGMRVLDVEKRTIRVNQAFAELVGISPEDAPGKKCFEYFTCPHSHTPACCFKRILGGEEYVECEFEITRRDGTRLWIFQTAAPFRDTRGQIIGVVQNFSDITVRKQAELSVLKAYEQWEKTFNAMGDIVTIHDPEMRIVRANKAASELLQLPIEQLIGKTCYSVFRGTDSPCEGCPESLAMLDYHVHTGEIVHPNLQKTFLVSISPIVDDNGLCTGFVHMAKDITELKNLEANLRQSQKMEAIGTLAGGIAHDFNNILGVIFGYTNFVRESLEPGAKEQEDLEQVLNAAHRAKDLVTQILAFSHKGETFKAPLAPALIVKDVLKFLRSTLSASIEIRSNITAGNAMILADPTQVYQVLMNLCINASHAMEQEGGVLDVELAEKMVDAEAATANLALTPGRYLALRVSDTGHGIAPEDMKRIFDPYFTTKEKGKGTGLGLAVVHGIVKEHGGDITVHSRPGEGTTFQVLFPVVEQGGGNAVNIEPLPLPGGKEKKEKDSSEA